MKLISMRTVPVVTGTAIERVKVPFGVVGLDIVLETEVSSNVDGGLSVVVDSLECQTSIEHQFISYTLLNLNST